MGILSILLSLVFLIVAVALILVILVQRPQGGGLAGAFGGAGGASSQSAFGAKTGDMLTYATVTIFILFLLTSMGMVWMNQSLFVGSAPAPPNAPSRLAVKVDSPTKILLTWADNSRNETGFVIQRSSDGLTGWSEVTAVDEDVTTHTLPGLTPESTYFFRVLARNSEGLSNPTDAIPVTLPKAEPVEPGVEAEGEGAGFDDNPAQPAPADGG